MRNTIRAVHFLKPTLFLFFLGRVEIDSSTTVIISKMTETFSCEFPFTVWYPYSPCAFFWFGNCSSPVVQEQIWCCSFSQNVVITDGKKITRSPTVLMETGGQENIRKKLLALISSCIWQTWAYLDCLCQHFTPLLPNDCPGPSD